MTGDEGLHVADGHVHGKVEVGDLRLAGRQPAGPRHPGGSGVAREPEETTTPTALVVGGDGSMRGLAPPENKPVTRRNPAASPRV